MPISALADYLHVPTRHLYHVDGGEFHVPSAKKSVYVARRGLGPGPS